jgi:hypothetical protein
MADARQNANLPPMRDRRPMPLDRLARAVLVLALVLLGAAHAPPHPASLAAYAAPDGTPAELCLSGEAAPNDGYGAGDGCPVCTLVAGAALPPPGPAMPLPAALSLAAAPITGPMARLAAVWRPDRARAPPSLAA